ncbi:cell division protein FtsQ/DivIB [Candidatus Avoscillospira sp. LCP25S3_F1]|uniref:cell division protein FtsQ/DivIB n=1 Tax=Candidatus Avoscillospira sp. LCP25S3_F1 TaxID=3438825 RepID=UPI003F8ED843
MEQGRYNGPSGGTSVRRPPTGGQRRYGRSGVLARIFVMLLVVAIFIFCAAIFFKITEIVVVGNNLYTDEEVVEASGLALGDNLLAVSRGTVAGRIQASLPYVEDVQVGRALPGTVTVTVRESDAVYAVYAANGTVWLMNSSGKLLEQAAPGASSYPWLVGVTVQTPQAGNQAVCAETEALDAALTVIQLLEATDYLPKIVEIDVTKPYDILLRYESLYEIHLGGVDQMEYKMRYLTAILADSQIVEGGIIDLTLEKENAAVFKPWSSTVSVPGTSGGDTEEPDGETTDQTSEESTGEMGEQTSPEASETTETGEEAATTDNSAEN